MESRASSDRRGLGSLVCAVAEVVIIGENLKNKHANLWPLSWTEARLFGVQGGERQGCRRKVLSSMSSKRELRRREHSGREHSGLQAAPRGGDKERVLGSHRWGSVPRGSPEKEQS